MNVDPIIVDYPAMTVFDPKAFPALNFLLDEDKGYCRVSTMGFTIRAFPRDKYEYIRNFYFGETDGIYYCNSKPAMLTSEPRPKEVTFGYELGDVVSVDGKKFKLSPTHNNNIKLEAVT
jgi:hypothetical protein